MRLRFSNRVSLWGHSHKRLGRPTPTPHRHPPVTLLPRDSQESWIVDDEATVYDESEGEPVEGDVADQVRDHFPFPETDYFPPTREVMAAWEALPQPRDPHYRVVFECELEVLANANPTPVLNHGTRRGWRR